MLLPPPLHTPGPASFGLHLLSSVWELVDEPNKEDKTLMVLMLIARLASIEFRPGLWLQGCARWRDVEVAKQSKLVEADLGLAARARGAFPTSLDRSRKQIFPIWAEDGYVV